tara:strand:- start:460 stop:570 length:111 start_codon:yes stop_codon:yes gene_type:complete
MPNQNALLRYQSRIKQLSDLLIYIEKVKVKVKEKEK